MNTVATNLKPKRILMFSGKRKSGKDYLTDKLHKILSPKSTIIRLSAPIKYYWATEHNLDYNQLLGDGAYKEKHRLAMAEWGIEKRSQNPGYFCTKAIEMVPEAKSTPIWIVSDLRYTSDLIWFQRNYDSERLCTVRVVASDDVRKSRGWVFTSGVDDMATECDLDGWDSYDFVMDNNSDEEAEKSLVSFVQLCTDIE